MRLRTALVLSAFLHAGLFLLPVPGLLTGPDRLGPTPGRGYVVTLFEPPGGESPAVELSPPAEPELQPQPTPVPEVVPTPEPAPKPAQETPAEAPAPAPGETAAPTPAAGDGAAGPAAEQPGGGQGGDRPVPPPVRFTPPQLLAGALPIDPKDSEALDVPEEIPVRLRVGTDGQVLEIVPGIADLPDAVTAALERSARAMRFLPARRGDRPVEAWFSMTFVFRR